MFLTESDLKRIAKYLSNIGIKDISLPDANIPISKDEYIAIIQDGINKKVKLLDLLNSASDWESITNKPEWIDSDIKPSYTAEEVGAISSDNLKTINGQSLIGKGNIEIQGSGPGGGIADAPSDGNKYVRQNNNWVVETDTSNFATKEELNSKVDINSISDMLTKTEASNKYQVKGNYLTEIPKEYITEDILESKNYVNNNQLNLKQDILQSGVNIKTINGNSILGEGNLNTKTIGNNKVTTLENLPINKPIIVATLNSNTNISLSSNIEIGDSIIIICIPTSSFEQTIPDSGEFISMDGTSIQMKENKLVEISILCYDTNKYSISCKSKY